MTATSAFMTNEEKADRHRQLIQAIEPYNQMLTDIYAKMPSTGFVVKNGLFERLPPFPEWQERIDKAIEMRNEFIKSNFPEFYSLDSNKI